MIRHALREEDDHPEDSRNWPETSGSAMFATAMITGVKLCLLDPDIYGPAARKAWLALTSYINNSNQLTETSDWCCWTPDKGDALTYYITMDGCSRVTREKQKGSGLDNGHFNWIPFQPSVCPLAEPIAMQKNTSPPSPMTASHDASSKPSILLVLICLAVVHIVSCFAASHETNVCSAVPLLSTLKDLFQFDAMVASWTSKSGSPKKRSRGK